MPERLTFILLLSLATTLVFCTAPDNVDEDDYDAELRGFSEYETWKPSQSSAPEVILIKHKDSHHHLDSMASIGSVIKHNLPLLAVLAPLVAVSVLLPLKAYLGPSYIVYPPVAAAPPAPPSKRISRAEDELFEDQSLAAQVLKMIEEIDKAYEEMAAKGNNKKGDV